MPDYPSPVPLDATSINAVASLVNPKVEQIKLPDGDLLVTNGLDMLEVYENPKIVGPDVIQVSTLTGLVDTYNYLGGMTRTASERSVENGGSSKPHDFVIHVVSPTKVQISVPVMGGLGQNLIYAVSEPLLPNMGLLGRYVDSETLMVFLLSSFVHTGERESLQKLLGNIKTGLAAETKDNGIGQVVTTVKGIARHEDTPVKNIWTLAPYRTFPELHQPASDFLYRLKDVTEKDTITALAALIEADGGAWRAEAIKLIGDWLKENLPDATILA